MILALPEEPLAFAPSIPSTQFFFFLFFDFLNHFINILSL
jgi:hypothetical protein